MKKDNQIHNESDLFREAMKDVEPLQYDKVEHRPPPKKPIRHQPAQHHNIDDRLSDDHVPPCGTHLAFERPGVQKNTLKKLRTGKLPVEASLDLHGKTMEQARVALLEFLAYCQQEQLKVITIVHGKGFGSESKKPVIKPLVNKWLQELDEVLAFVSAQPQHGGTGAVYVLLRRNKSD